MIPVICFKHSTKINEKGPTNVLSAPLNENRLCELLHHHGFAYAATTGNQGVGIDSCRQTFTGDG